MTLVLKIISGVLPIQQTSHDFGATDVTTNIENGHASVLDAMCKHVLGSASLTD